MAKTQFVENVLGKGEGRGLLYLLHSFFNAQLRKRSHNGTVMYASIWQPNESIAITVSATIN